VVQVIEGATKWDAEGRAEERVRGWDEGSGGEERPRGEDKERVRWRKRGQREERWRRVMRRGGEKKK
jgi:hypothetical protein